MIGSSLFALDELEKSENGRLSIPKTYNIELKRNVVRFSRDCQFGK